MKVAILDDYQNVALSVADWSRVEKLAEITVFNDHLDSSEALVERLKPFDVLCVMRERTPLNEPLIAMLPNLKVIASTGPVNASIDNDAAAKHGITVLNTGYDGSPTVELVWALLLATVRHLPEEVASVRAGGWQQQVGTGLKGKTLGILGLGRLGTAVAHIGVAFGMLPIAWSENLTAEKAEAAGVRLVSKDELLSQSDVLTIHLVLSPRSTHLIDANALARMKPSAFLINTSRGPIVEEAALIEAVKEKRLAGAGVDVYDVEPLPADHPLRTLDGIVTTPHIGYVTQELYHVFYQDLADGIAAWAESNRAPDTTQN